MKTQLVEVELTPDQISKLFTDATKAAPAQTPAEAPPADADKELADALLKLDEWLQGEATVADEDYAKQLPEATEKVKALLGDSPDSVHTLAALTSLTQEIDGDKDAQAALFKTVLLNTVNLIAGLDKDIAAKITAKLLAAVKAKYETRPQQKPEQPAEKPVEKTAEPAQAEKPAAEPATPAEPAAPAEPAESVIPVGPTLLEADPPSILPAAAAAAGPAVTLDTLTATWEKDGKPTDSDKLAQVMLTSGVPKETVTKLFAELGITYPPVAVKVVGPNIVKLKPDAKFGDMFKGDIREVTVLINATDTVAGEFERALNHAKLTKDPKGLIPVLLKLLSHNNYIMSLKSHSAKKIVPEMTKAGKDTDAQALAFDPKIIYNFPNATMFAAAKAEWAKLKSENKEAGPSTPAETPAAPITRTSLIKSIEADIDRAKQAGVISGPEANSAKSELKAKIPAEE